MRLNSSLTVKRNRLEIILWSIVLKFFPISGKTNDLMKLFVNVHVTFIAESRTRNVLEHQIFFYDLHKRIPYPFYKSLFYSDRSIFSISSELSEKLTRRSPYLAFLSLHFREYTIALKVSTESGCSYISRISPIVWRGTVLRFSSSTPCYREVDIS